MERSAQDPEARSDEIVDTRSTAHIHAWFILGFLTSVAAS
jgi:hypothetical protein